MILRHATTQACFERIKYEGLRVACAGRREQPLLWLSYCIKDEGLRVACADPQAKIKACWFHTPRLTTWAILHTMQRHKAPLEAIVIVEFQVPRRWLTRFRVGLWYTKQDVEASRIRRIIPGIEFSKCDMADADLETLLQDLEPVYQRRKTMKKCGCVQEVINLYGVCENPETCPNAIIYRVHFSGTGNGFGFEPEDFGTRAEAERCKAAFEADHPEETATIEETAD